MLIFEAIDAAHGDAILVRYKGAGGFQRIILVDGGPKSARNEKDESYIPFATRIIPRLMQIKAERDAKSKNDDIHSGQATVSLDLVVCTHIDDDHIAGIERLYRCLSGNGGCVADSDKVEAKTLWFNSFSKLLGDAVDIDEAVDAETVSVAQGENLTAFAGKHGATINHGAPGQLIAVGQQPKGLLPAKVTIINPDKDALTKLRKDWLTKVKGEAEVEPQAAGKPVKFKPDHAVANLSSIVMLIEVFGRKLLLTGDQRGDHVLEGLEKRLEGGKLHVDIMKVPHHGAVGNNQKPFIEAVTADTYVFSANGKDQNPDTPVLEMIAAEAKKNRKFTMAFTNGAMVYAKDKNGDFPKIAGKEVRTLEQAISELKKDADIKNNVSFIFRDPGMHSLVLELKPKP